MTVFNKYNIDFIQYGQLKGKTGALGKIQKQGCRGKCDRKAHINMHAI